MGGLIRTTLGELRSIIRQELNENASTDLAEAHRICAALKAFGNRMSVPGVDWRSEVLTTPDGYPRGVLPSTIGLTKGYDNVLFIFWYEATESEAMDYMMYFKDTDEEDIAEEHRTYLFTIGDLGIRSHRLTPDEVMEDIAERLTTQLRDFKTNVTHEVAHLSTLRRMSTTQAKKQWGLKDINNGLEVYPNLLDFIHGELLEYEDDPQWFRDEFASPEELLHRLRELRPIRINRALQKYSEKSLLKKLSQIWQLYATGHAK